MGIFERVRTEPLIKQYGDFRAYPYAKSTPTAPTSPTLQASPTHAVRHLPAGCVNSQGGRGGAAMTLRERVLAAIREHPGITINELLRRLDGPGRPAVYHQTWVLYLKGAIVRHRAETSRAYLHYPVARGAPLGDGSLDVIVTRWHDG